MKVSDWRIISIWPTYSKGTPCDCCQHYDEAMKCFLKASDLTGGNSVCLAEVGHIHALRREANASSEILQKLRGLAQNQYVSPHLFALIHLALGEKDKAFEYLGETLDERGAYLIFLTTDPVYDSVRGEPEFLKLVARVGFVSPAGCTQPS